MALFWSSFATGIWAASSPGAEPTSWTLTCETETNSSTETSARIAIIKVTADNASQGPILHWKSPSGSWVTLALRPVTDRAWASRLDLGDEDGTHQLQCMFVGGTDVKEEIVSRTYQFSTADMTLAETGVPETWSHASEMEKPTLAPIISLPVQPTLAAPQPEAEEKPVGSSWVLAIMLLGFLNLMFAFAAGLAFAVHRRHKAHRDDAALLQIKQQFLAAGLLGTQPDPVPATPEAKPDTEPEQIDAAEAAAEDTAIEAMNKTIEEATEEPAADSPDEGVDIRKAHEQEAEIKVDMNDLSF
ncbi:hypothetical protein LLG95_04620 [bacterium]|nr:hypothetical protein [bacterium]